MTMAVMWDRRITKEVAEAIEREILNGHALDLIDERAVQRIGLQLGSHDLALLPDEVQHIAAGLLGFNLVQLVNEPDKLPDVAAAVFAAIFVVSRFYTRGGGAKRTTEVVKQVQLTVVDEEERNA